jgi:hypothetical protein
LVDSYPPLTEAANVLFTRAQGVNPDVFTALSPLLPWQLVHLFLFSFMAAQIFVSAFLTASGRRVVVAVASLAAPFFASLAQPFCSIDLLQLAIIGAFWAFALISFRFRNRASFSLRFILQLLRSEDASNARKVVDDLLPSPCADQILSLCDVAPNDVSVAHSLVADAALSSFRNINGFSQGPVIKSTQSVVIIFCGFSSH